MHFLYSYVFTTMYVDKEGCATTDKLLSLLCLLVLTFKVSLMQLFSFLSFSLFPSFSEFGIFKMPNSDSVLIEQYYFLILTAEKFFTLQFFFPVNTERTETFLCISAIVDITFTWKTRSTMDPFKIRRNLLKVFIPTIWIIILPIYYVNYRGKYTCYSTENHSWLGEWCYSSYMVAVSFYLMTNAVDMVLFFVPMVGKYIETSNMRICTILSWWTQVQLLVDLTLTIIIK